MLRVCSLFALAFGLLCLTAFRAEKPKCNDRLFPINTTQALSQFGGEWFPLSHSALSQWPDTDTSTALRILMLNYNAYDSAYAGKVRGLIQAQLPASSVSEFWEGTAYDLNSALASHDAVVITYPFGGNAEVNKMYGKLLTQYARQGGIVVFTGTYDYQTLQQFGLFDVEFGYFCQDPVLHHIATEHPILDGTAEQFPLSDFAYPLEISDPDFVTLVDVFGYQEEESPISCWTDTKEEVNPASLRGIPVLGYKPLGLGKVVYIGMEYYYEQSEPARILTNALRWATQSKVSAAALTVKETRLNRAVKRSEEVLQAGSGPKQEVFDLKIYPNPYYEKATLDIELKKSTTVVVEMTDETGRIVAVVLPQKKLSAGFYRLELPNLTAGVYFVQCKTGEKTTMSKVVKSASR